MKQTFNFRQKLKQFFANSLKENLILICNPKKFLIDCGIPNKTIAITKKTLNDKIELHNLDKSNLENINTLINTPLMVFRSITYSGAFNIIIQEKNNEGLLCVSLHPNKKIDKLEINEIASIHGRRITQLTDWCENGLLIKGNYKKTKEVTNCSQFNSAQSDYLLSFFDGANLNKENESTKKNQEKNNKKNNNFLKGSEYEENYIINDNRKNYGDYFEYYQVKIRGSKKDLDECISLLKKEKAKLSKPSDYYVIEEKFNKKIYETFFTVTYKSLSINDCEKILDYYYKTQKMIKIARAKIAIAKAKFLL